jgi:hypothetical protein
MDQALSVEQSSPGAPVTVAAAPGACDAKSTPIILQCPQPEQAPSAGMMGQILGMGWPFALLLIILLVITLDRGGRIGSLFDAIISFIRKAKSVAVGGTTITTAMEEALQREPAVGVAPVGDVVSERVNGDDLLIKKLLAQDYTSVTTGDYPYLMHEGKRTPKGKFPYAARVYLEFWTANGKIFQKDAVQKVFYRVDNTFPKQWWVMTSDDVDTDFQLVVRIQGEFTVVAVVKLKTGEYIWLTRYLDLPGRPTA